VNTALVPLNRLRALPRGGPNAAQLTLPLRDSLDRPLTDLRLSVTDRCNFRCTYCMPRDKVGPAAAPSPRKDLLTFEQITQIAAAFRDLGVRKIRITGGEPLVRRNLPRLVELLHGLEIPDLCLTTNGSLLAEQAPALAAAGLGRVTVSLDALDEPTFQRMADTQTSLRAVLAGIEAARKWGILPVKINMVVQRNVNQHSIIPMAAWARAEGLELRFIEYMDVGCSNGWQARDVVSAREIRQLIHQRWPLEPAEPSRDFETAVRYRYRDGAGHIGVIASISQPFCRGCTRARVSSQGELYTCLFAPVGFSLAGPLRQGADLRRVIADLWRERADRYSELRSENTIAQPRPEMSAIGG
jgi:cyclic pyranopterin phosphate synthase